MILAGRIMLVLMLLGAGWRMVHQLVAFEIARLYPTIEPLRQAIEWDPEGPDAYYLLGRIYANSPQQRDLELARRHLENATKLNPLNWWYWMELAEVYEISGMQPEAEEAYLKAMEINPREADYRWRFANFYLRERELSKALPEFEKAIELEPREYLETTLALLSKAGVSNDEILGIWPEDKYARLVLMRFLVGREAVDQELLKRQWRKLFEGSAIPTVVEGEFYIRYLLNQERFGEAKQEWIRLNGEDAFESLVWNGEFELPMTGRVLDWKSDSRRVHPAEEQGGTRDNAESLVRIEFEGKENLNFSGLRQLVIIDEGGDYEFSFRARSEGISTEQGLYFEVVAGSVLLQTEQILGNTPWTEYSNRFKVPKDQSLVTVRLRRRPSKRIENKLRGTLWLDWVRLERLTTDN